MHQRFVDKLNLLAHGLAHAYGPFLDDLARDRCFFARDGNDNGLLVAGHVGYLRLRIAESKQARCQWANSLHQRSATMAPCAHRCSSCAVSTAKTIRRSPRAVTRGCS